MTINTAAFRDLSPVRNIPAIHGPKSVCVTPWIWEHISCCTEEKNLLPCTFGTKDVLLGVDFCFLTWQTPMTYPPHQLPNAPNVPKLQHQLHSHGYLWRNSSPYPLHLLVAWLLMNEWSSGHGWSDSWFFCSFESLVRHWLSWSSGEHSLGTSRATLQMHMLQEAAYNYLNNTGSAHYYISVYLCSNMAQYNTV